MYRGYTVSLVIPCYNEEEGLRNLLEDVPSVVDEILVVDNNSADDTASVAMSYGARVVYEPMQGYGHAYRAGFENASGDIIATMDADGMYPLESIKRLVKNITDDGYDFITARRIPDRRRSFSSFIRYFGDVVLNLITRVLFAVKVKDSQSGMWVFKKDMLPLLNITSTGMAMSQELKIEAIMHPEVQVIEIPVLYKDKRIGESKLSLWRDGFGNLAFLFRKWWKYGRRIQYSSDTPRTVTNTGNVREANTLTTYTGLEMGDAARNIYHHSGV